MGVEQVALEAGCAKGSSTTTWNREQELLGRCGRTRCRPAGHGCRALLGGRRGRSTSSGWPLVREDSVGEFAAWCAIAAAPKIEGPPSRATDSEALAAAVARALDLAPWDPARAILLPAALDGLQLALLLGAPESQVRESYHLLWLTLLP